MPTCASLNEGEERRSCLLEEDSAFVYIWGTVDQSFYIKLWLHFRGISAIFTNIDNFNASTRLSRMAATD